MAKLYYDNYPKENHFCSVNMYYGQIILAKRISSKFIHSKLKISKMNLQQKKKKKVNVYSL